MWWIATPTPSARYGVGRTPSPTWPRSAARRESDGRRSEAERNERGGAIGTSAEAQALFALEDHRSLRSPRLRHRRGRGPRLRRGAREGLEYARPRERVA